MRRTGPLSKNVSGDLKFGSDVADLLGLPVEEVAAIVGAIVGGRARAFVVAMYRERACLPLMVPRANQAGTAVTELIEQSIDSGAVRIICATPSGSPPLDLSVQESSECGGVRFEIVLTDPQGRRGGTAVRRKETSSRL